MKNGSHEDAPARTRGKHGLEPTLQVICLASGGGPAEDNVTGFLVRALATNWSKQSVLAVDAGSHLASITRLLQADFPLVSEPQPSTHIPSSNGTHSKPATRPSSAGDGAASESSCSSLSTSPEPTGRTLTSGPFANLSLPYETARANALHIVREHVSTYLITHPHLDHIAAFAMNTAAFHATSRPKRLAALPSTVNAIKTHIFNDVIWPNLTDEDGGVGFVTFQRLTEGGNLAVGEGRGKGYIEVCDGLCVKGMKVSHGHCARGALGTTAHRGSEVGLSEAVVYNRGGSVSGGMGSSDAISPTTNAHRTPSITQLSLPPPTPGLSASNPSAPNPAPAPPPADKVVVDSTAYFIRADASHRELLVFGDVEPDALSLHPRTAAVWAEAAPKIATGHLRGIVIECSYDDSQPDAVLFGHLCPRHLVRELGVLAGMVRVRLAERRRSRKRKRGHGHGHAHRPSHLDTHTHGTTTTDTTRAPSLDPSAQVSDGADVLTLPDGSGNPDPSSAANKRGRLSLPTDSTSAPAPSTTTTQPHPPALDTTPTLQEAPNDPPPLTGLTILIMHIKDSMKDGPLVGDTILRQLVEHEARLQEADGVGLGCEFVISRTGGHYCF